MDGYKEAMQIDRRINKLLEDDPITEENKDNWFKFARTVETSCLVIKGQIESMGVLSDSDEDEEEEEEDDEEEEEEDDEEEDDEEEDDEEEEKSKKKSKKKKRK